MKTQLVFLRAVNVGGHGAIGMAELRAWLTRLGFADVRTLLHSGNAVFRSEGATGESLERQLEAAAATKFGFTTDFFVRSLDEWNDVIANNPFPKETKADPARLAVVVLKAAPAAAHVKALQAAIAAKAGKETVRARGRALYAFYPDGQGRSKLTLPLIEKHLGTRGTARNWNTVLKMAAATTA